MCNSHLNGLEEEAADWAFSTCPKFRRRGGGKRIAATTDAVKKLVLVERNQYLQD